jgi:mono/diheme cytochrome c family protein
MTGTDDRQPRQRTSSQRGTIYLRILAAACLGAALIYIWLATPAAAQTGAPNAPSAGAQASTQYPAGEAIFQANCAVCHQAKGTGNPALAPPITSYPARYATIPEGRKQLAMTVVNGMFGKIEVEQKSFDFRMPEFTQLDDATLAGVLNFIIFDLDHAPSGTRPMTAEEIAAERAHPVEGSAVREHRAKVLAALGL